MAKFVLVVALAVSALAGLADAAIVRMETVLGTIDVEVYDSTPVTKANFLRYVNEGLYDYSLFHRSMPGFVFQGGGIVLRNTPLGDELQWVPTYDPIVNEFSPDRSNLFGTIAMAKVEYDPNTGTGGPDSATSQWFFNLADNSANLDYQNGGFTVFGHIVAGVDVLLALEALQTWNFGGAFSNLPTLDTFTYESPELTLDDMVWLYSAVLLADANDDGIVDAADYMAFKRNFGKASGATWEQGDFDGDGDVDSYDKYLLEYSFGMGPITAGENVPEPATLSLLAMGWLAVMRRRRKS